MTGDQIILDGGGYRDRCRLVAQTTRPMLYLVAKSAEAGWRVKHPDGQYIRAQIASAIIYADRAGTPFC